MLIGKLINQPGGYKAFVPEDFPPVENVEMERSLVNLFERASHSLGKLDGITKLLPDLDFFIFMYVRKEAALSSQIEGTKATMIQSIEAEAEIEKELPKDVDDILHYIKAMNFGLKRLEELPLSLRLIREVHKVLLTGARKDHFANPGEFRRSQNWIGGASPQTARFVPPPVYEMTRALGDLEKFMYSKDELPILIKTGLIHSQFETIHPFLDGNGRAGRLLITFYLCQQKMLERPVLYLSGYFKRNRELYFDLLDRYHTTGDIISWLKFFLNGVAEVADDAIITSEKITKLRDTDMAKIQTLGRSAKSASDVLLKLYELPIVNVRTIQDWTGYSRSSANELVGKLIDIGILKQRDASATYGRDFAYRDYLNIFSTE